LGEPATDPYSPPKAPLREEPPPPGSAFKAVTLGLLVDIGGTMLTSVALGIAYGATLAASGMNRGEIEAALANISEDSLISIAGSLIGMGFSVLGGFVCARISRRQDYRLGSVLGTMSAGLGFAMGLGQVEAGWNLALALTTFGAVLLGTRLGMRTRSPMQ
jgi:hypothetical protein